MKEEREVQMKKRKKEERGKTTIFGWNIADMPVGMNFIYLFVVVALFAGMFWFLYNKVAHKKAVPKKAKSKKRAD